MVSGQQRRANSSSRRRNAETTPNQESADTVLIDESILSLLLKLHSALSGTLDSFSLDDHYEEEMEDDHSDGEEPGPSSPAIKVSESRIGDGPHFIGNLLKKIALMDASCARNIDEIRHKLWPNQRERQAEQRAREIKEKDERSKRSKERQAKLMQDFANKQKQFMAQAMAAEGDLMEGIDDDDEEMLLQAREKDYDCIICNTTGPSTESNPIGLVVLVESSSIVGHRRKAVERFPLPVCDEDKSILGAR